MKTKVRMMEKDYFKKWNEGDTGYIDGYFKDSDGSPRAIIVIGTKIVTASLRELEVIE